MEVVNAGFVGRVLKVVSLFILVVSFSVNASDAGGESSIALPAPVVEKVEPEHVLLITFFNNWSIHTEQLPASSRTKCINMAKNIFMVHDQKGSTIETACVPLL